MSTGFMIFLKNICFCLLCFSVFWFFKNICFRKKQSKKQHKPEIELQAYYGQQNKSSSPSDQSYNKVKRFSLRGGTATTTTTTE
ncbi:unnamed protein product [Brassica oleracea var. botrytis]